MWVKHILKIKNPYTSLGCETSTKFGHENCCENACMSVGCRTSTKFKTKQAMRVTDMNQSHLASWHGPHIIAHLITIQI